jgi:hypothetical protein
VQKAVARKQTLFSVSSFGLLLSAFCLPFTAYCLLLTAYRPLRFFELSLRSSRRMGLRRN